LNDFPGEIKKTVRVMTNDASLVICNNQSFYEKHVIWADSNFFSVFSFPLLRGNPATCLNDPNSIVLTETTAKKYFGNEDPMGKIVEINKTLKVMVTGIAKDVPPNSTLHLNFALSLNWFTDKPGINVWTNNPDFIYVVLDEHDNKANIEKRFPAFMEKYMGNEMRKMGFHFFLSLVPLRDIYFENASAFDNVSQKSGVYLFERSRANTTYRLHQFYEPVNHPCGRAQ
jgi:putative ABC transport system permease protein